MDLINEILDQEMMDDLLKDMDSVLEQYKSLNVFAQLNEGVLDNLSDDLIQKVSEIQRRIEVIAKARGIVDKLKKSGGFSKDEVSKHRARLRNNRKALTAALRRVEKRMDQFKDQAEKQIKAADRDGKDPSENPQSDVDLRAFGKVAPFLMRKAVAGELDVNELDPDKYGETIEMLQGEGLIDQNGNATDKGEAAYKAHAAKKSAPKPQASRDAIDDLAGFGGDSDALDDLAFGS